MRLEIKIEDEAAFVRLLKKIDAKDSVDLINTALSLLSWFCKQEAEGRSVASISDGKVYHTMIRMSDGWALRDVDDDD